MHDAGALEHLAILQVDIDQLLPIARLEEPDIVAGLRRQLGMGLR
jgi:hypothetical protein